MEEILRKLEILKNQMKENAAKLAAKPDSEKPENMNKLSGFVFDKTEEKDILKGSSFSELKFK